MNKYIKSDIENGLKYLKVGIMNALYDIDSGEELEIDLGPYISKTLLLQCLSDAKWTTFIYYQTDDLFWAKSPSGKNVQILNNRLIKIYGDNN